MDVQRFIYITFKPYVYKIGIVLHYDGYNTLYNKRKFNELVTDYSRCWYFFRTNRVKCLGV